jgi:hypothetical protein
MIGRYSNQPLCRAPQIEIESTARQVHTDHTLAACLGARNTESGIDKRWIVVLKAILAAALAVAGLLSMSQLGAAAPAPFDLAGPNLQVTVTRGERTLPIGEVPNLAAGDRVVIKTELPATQSAHYLLIAAFLNGATNPPPSNQFYSCKTWTRSCQQQGLAVTVPKDAEQVLVFLAPETSGDYRTVVNAVRGRPGAFVRASQDLNQAMLDRSRLERYLIAIRSLDQESQSKLREAAPLLARSLAIKVDDHCLDRIPELQAPCLMQGRESLILNDGHSTSIVEALTSGPASDLAMEASYTPQLSYGYYSPYFASILDIARIFDSFHSAQYQYIPALAAASGDQLALSLNTPPSFYDPKSVLVIALPAVERPQLPPLHAVDPAGIYCARKSALVLPVEGAPLVFSTGFAFDMTLSLAGQDGKGIDLPAKADPEQGGFVVDTTALGSTHLGESVQGVLHGRWGFEEYRGPSFQLVNATTQSWALGDQESNGLIVGREELVHLQANSVSCIDNIMLRDPAGKEIKTEWKTVKPNVVELKLPLQEMQPGPMTLLVSQYGASQPQPLGLVAFSEAGHLSGFLVHAGDSQGVLKGTRLDEVAALQLKGVEFAPATLSSSQGDDELVMTTQDAHAQGLKPQTGLIAKVTLKDGRVLNLTAAIAAPRPSATLIGRSVQTLPGSVDHHVQLANPDELPQDGTLTFSVRTQSPAAFSHDEMIEIATTDESFSTLLSAANGGITLENAQVAVAQFSPLKAFGAAAFGPLHYRVAANGVAGDWQPLGTLVRLPVLKEIKCPATVDLACKLSGTDLFLVESLSSDPHFRHATPVPDGFPGGALPVPHPGEGPLYLKLRDDPNVVNRTSLRIEQLPASTDPSDRSAERLGAAQGESESAPTSNAGTPEENPQAPQSGSSSMSGIASGNQLDTASRPAAVPAAAIVPATKDSGPQGAETPNASGGPPQG